MPVSYSWPLSSPPQPTAPIPTEPDAAALLAPSAAISTRSGLLTPFRRGPRDFINGTGAVLVSSKILQALGTRCEGGTHSGELLWRGDFGSMIELARHQNNDDVLTELLRQWCSDALAKWVPEVRVIRVDVERQNDAEGNPVIAHARVHWEVGSGAAIERSSTPVPLGAT